MQRFVQIARFGVIGIIANPLRSVVTTICLMAMLVPFLTGMGLSAGIQQQAEDSIRFGADLYVSGSQLGRSVAVPLEAVARIREIEGVMAVTPRIVGRVVLGTEREEAVLVGLPDGQVPAATNCVAGRFYAAGSTNELVVGSELARRLNLRVGALIPPFYRSATGERISTVVGIFESDVPIWQSKLILTSLDTAANILDQSGLATDLLVDCRPGYRATVHRTILQNLSGGVTGANGHVRVVVTSRDELSALVPRGLLHREGVFDLCFLLAFVVGILTLLVVSGVGLSERRREIGILKAIGWQTDEILLRGIVESFLISLAGASLSVLLAFVWLNWLNGYWIASIFLFGVDAAPAFDVPSRFGATPTLLSLLFSLVLTMSGTLYSSWRAAIVSPAEAMR